jgi:phage recombination protein Bet
MKTEMMKHEPSALDTLVSKEWPRTVLDIALRQSCPAGMPEDEKYVFLKKCQQTGLNPLAGEVYCIPRNDKHKGKVYTFQPSAEGMRARAGRFPDFLGCDGGAVYEKDLVTMDQGKGEISHKSNPAAARGNLKGAWGRVTKKDGSRFLVWLPVGSRSGTTEFWVQDAGGMLRKCAIVAALREAYPVAFGGVYAREEMDDAPAISRADVMFPRVDAPAKEEPALPAAGPVVKFGEFNGRPIVALSSGELAAAIKEGEDWKQLHPKAKPKVLESLDGNLAQLRAALEPKPPTVDDAEEVPARDLPISHPDAQPPEPGSEG